MGSVLSLFRVRGRFLASWQDAAARFPCAEAGRCDLDFASLNFESALECAADFIDIDEDTFPHLDVGEIPSGFPFREASFRDCLGSGSEKCGSAFLKADKCRSVRIVTHDERHDAPSYGAVIMQGSGSRDSPYFFGGRPRVRPSGNQPNPSVSSCLFTSRAFDIDGVIP